jgi:hypothetical protein
VLPPAPGGVAADDHDSFSRLALTVVGTTPYLGLTAFANAQEPGYETADISVWRLGASGDGWEHVEGLQNHDPGTLAFISPDGIISVDGTPWVTWGEYGGEGGRLKVRVARLVDGDFQVLAGGQPVNDPDMHANTGNLVTLDGRVYVSFEEGQHAGGHYPPQVARVATDGGSFERVSTGLPDSDGSDWSRLVAAGGRLNFLHQHAFDEWTLFGLDDADTWSEQFEESGRVADAEYHDGALHVAFAPLDVVRRRGVWRITQHGGLEQVGDIPFGDAKIESIASAGGTLYAVGRTEGAAPSFHGDLRFAAYRDGAWEQLPVPTGPDERVEYFSELEPAADGSVWLRYTVIDSDGATTERVARYGEPPAAPPDQGTPAGPPEDGGGFTDPQGNPAPDAPSVRRGSCANQMRGTRLSDRLVGGSLGDRIKGLAGDDALFGRGGSDCLWGDGGLDIVSGGRGRDAISGGAGADRIVPGPDSDTVAAGHGRDVVIAGRGGVDWVNCGPGRDTVSVSRNDLIKGCERVILVRR